MHRGERREGKEEKRNTAILILIEQIKNKRKHEKSTFYKNFFYKIFYFAFFFTLLTGLINNKIINLFLIKSIII